MPYEFPTCCLRREFCGSVLSIRTENHVRQAFERNGHTVIPLQENTPQPWSEPVDADLVLSTRTGWDWSEACGWSQEEAWSNSTPSLSACATRAHRRSGFHLDRWWGLDREHQIFDEPFFRCDLMCTADGGHDDQWQLAGINHVWMPPGVSLAECEREPVPRPEYARQPVVWVGSWQHYHPEWVGYRRQLIDTLRRHFRRRFGIYPRGGKAIRGQALRDLYAQALVIVGDSCLVGGATHYLSDRVPESLGRGGFLLHPWVEGVMDEVYTDGEHLVTWQLGEWGRLIELCDYYLRHDGEREEIRQAGRAHVMEHRHV